MNKISILSISLCLSLPIFNTQLFAKEIQTVATIDVNKYAGKWYEIARLPMFFQRNCVSDVSATYTLNSDKTIKVVNQCIKQNGKMDSANGVAYPQNSANTKLKVSFLPDGLKWLPKTKGDYWIMRIDPNYQVALVGEPNKEFLWLLSRTPNLDQKTYQSYLETAKQQGYDLSKLIKTQHTAQ